MATQRREARQPAPPTSTGSPLPKLIFILAIVALAAYLVFPLKKRMTLGLDLQGGTQMSLLVDLDDAVYSSGERTLDDIRRAFDDAGVKVANSIHDKATATEITIKSSS